MHILALVGSCRNCFDQGGENCPLKDDVTQIRVKNDASNAPILASPVYVDDVSGLMKNLMDRLAYLSHRPALGGRYAYAPATVGGGAYYLKHSANPIKVALARLTGAAVYRFVV